VRKQHPVFGRGSLTLLGGDDVPPSVLAYVRANDDETILVVNNLSAEPQDVALDLGAVGGRTATDLLSRTELEIAASGTLAVSLDRYGYCWLALEAI
jgi:maltose alpha-D-glucosyltransferase / alpha-amylase